MQNENAATRNRGPPPAHAPLPVPNTRGRSTHDTQPSYSPDDYDSPLRENIKIVVVGDSATGKSKLVYAQACKRTFSENELNACYVPTVWAIDQYKHRRDVQELSNTSVDGALITVRIWDTFGDHSKDRYFAYQNADVVVLCFSLCDRYSLRNVQSKWLKEIRHYLKNVPVVLAGTMLDMRWKDLHTYNRTRSRFNRHITPHEIISTDEARDISETLCLPYYETSVLNGYGVSDLFENAVRAALVHRRSSRMYTMNHLRKVREPLLQPPCLPPEPPCPELQPVSQSTFMAELSCLFTTEDSADTVLVCQQAKFFCHRLLLLQHCRLFAQVVERHRWLGPAGGDSSDGGEPTTDSDLDSEHNGDSGSERGGKSAFGNLYLEGAPILRVVADECGRCELLVHDNIPSSHLAVILYFVYNLSLPARLSCSLFDLQYTAKLLQMSELVDMLTSLCKQQQQQVRPQQLRQQLVAGRKLMLEKHYTAQQSQRTGDFSFNVLGDHVLWVHKYIVTARSQFMNSLLRGSFRESQGSNVNFTDVSYQALNCVLFYLYCDHLPPQLDTDCDWVEMIELANRFCLDRLIQLLEHECLARLGKKLDQARKAAAAANPHKSQELKSAVIKECVILVDKCELYNAHNLYQWCIHHLSHNYDFMCRTFSFLKQTCLTEATTAILLSQRWPPVWYIKEKDYYDRRARLLAKVEADKRQMKAGLNRWWLWRKQKLL